nr:hypothetical protein [Urbifossiella limnaea]
MIRRNCVRRLMFTHSAGPSARARCSSAHVPLTTYTVPAGASSAASSRYGRSAAKIGATRYAFPVAFSVFGFGTIIRPPARSTSAHRSFSVSLGHRSPPNRDSAMIVRHTGDANPMARTTSAAVT